MKFWTSIRTCQREFGHDKVQCFCITVAILGIYTLYGRFMVVKICCCMFYHFDGFTVVDVLNYQTQLNKRNALPDILTRGRKQL